MSGTERRAPLSARVSNSAHANRSKHISDVSLFRSSLFGRKFLNVSRIKTRHLACIVAPKMIEPTRSNHDTYWERLERSHQLRSPYRGDPSGPYQGLNLVVVVLHLHCVVG